MLKFKDANNSSSKIDAKLKELGLELPEAATPAANYVPFIISGNLLSVSGQLCVWNGEIKYAGKLGKDFQVKDGQEAAKICALNIISHAKVACGGNLDKIKKCVRLGVFVNSTPDFTDQPAVANGASDLIVSIFAEKGKHSRAAVGVAQLPRNVAVEIEALFEIEN